MSRINILQGCNAQRAASCRIQPAFTHSATKGLYSEHQGIKHFDYPGASSLDLTQRRYRVGLPLH